MKASWIIAAAATATVCAADNVTVVRPNEPFVPDKQLPPSHATTDGGEIVQLFTNLGRSTSWTLISKTPFEGDTGEPEGIVRVGGNRYFVSSGQWTVPTQKYGRWINGTDRTPGEGYAHMLIYDGKGKLIANATLSQPGDLEYHTGGIDYDGQYIWDTLSQYRPNSTATIVRIDPRTLNKTSMWRTNDHNGGIVHDTVTNEIATLNWGSRNATTWSLNNYPGGFTRLPGFTRPDLAAPNPSSYVDYQDCKYLGHHPVPSTVAAGYLAQGSNDPRPMMACGGVATISYPSSSVDLGGIALVDMQTMSPIWEVPVQLQSDLGVTMTENPIDFAVVNGKLRIYALPDQHTSTLYVYEAN